MLVENKNTFKFLHLRVKGKEMNQRPNSLLISLELNKASKGLFLLYLPLNRGI